MTESPTLSPRAYRETVLRLSTEGLARRLGITAKHYEKYERGGFPPEAFAARALRLLGVPFGAWYEAGSFPMKGKIACQSVGKVFPSIGKRVSPSVGKRVSQSIGKVFPSAADYCRAATLWLACRASTRRVLPKGLAELITIEDMARAAAVLSAPDAFTHTHTVTGGF